MTLSTAPSLSSSIPSGSLVCHVRRHDNLIAGQYRMVRRERLRVEHVEGGPGQMAGLERSQSSPLVSTRSPRPPFTSSAPGLIRPSSPPADHVPCVVR